MSSALEFLQRRKKEQELETMRTLTDPGGIKNTIRLASQPKPPPPPRDVSRDVISQGKPEEISTFRKLIRAIPGDSRFEKSFERDVFDPIAKVAKFFAPEVDDYRREAVEKLPNASMDQIEALAKELMVADDFTPIGGDAYLSPLDMVPATTGRVGALMLARAGVKRGIRKIIEAVTEDSAKKVAREIAPNAKTAENIVNDILKAKSEADAKKILDLVKKKTESLKPEDRIATFLEERSGKATEETTTFYRGEGANTEGKNVLEFGEAPYITKNPEYAKNYGKVKQVELDPEAFIVKAEARISDELKQVIQDNVPVTKRVDLDQFISKNPEATFRDVWKRATDYGKDSQLINKALQDAGVDGIDFSAGRIINGEPVSSVAVLNPAKLVTKELSMVDEAIAKGDVRVVSREGRDVYQMKQGDKWVTKRDEDSVLRSLTPKVKEKEYIPVDPVLEERFLAATIRKEALDADPARDLAKFASKTGENKGVIPEVVGRTKGKFANEGDSIVTELGYQSSEEARDAYQKYLLRKADVEAEMADARDAIKQARLEKKQATLASKLSDEISPEPPKPQTTPEEVRSLEEVADQMFEASDLPPSKKGLSLEEIVTQTPISAKVNLLDYLRTPNRVLKKIGFEKEAALLREKYDDYLKELPKNIDKVTAWYKQVPKDAGERIFKYLDGQEVELVGNEMKVASEIKDYLSTWADRLGLPNDKRVTNYITRLFDDQLIAKEFDEDLAKIISTKVPGEVYNPFLQKRLGAMGYKQDVWLALDAYTKRATRKVHMDPALGKMQDKAGSSLEFSNLEKSQFDYIKQYIDRVNMRPTDLDNLLDNTIKGLFGYRLGQRPVNSITRLMRQMTYRSFLGANLSSAMRNLSQGANTYAILGEKDFVLGYAKLFNKKNWEELAEEGIFQHNIIQDRALSSTKKTLEKADKALWIFFDTAEKINRGSAYLGAKTKGLRKGMTEEEAVTYAKDIVSKTQFNYDAIETPVAMSSDLVKTLLQFQTYTTKQTEFLVELAKDKNFAGLARYALAGTAFVYTIGQAFGMEEKELLPINGETFSRFELAPSAKLAKEVTLAAMDAPDKYGNKRDIKEKLEDIGGTLWGIVPGGSQIKKTLEGAEAVEQGGSFDSLGRKQFPVGGTEEKDLQAILFGKYANEEAKNFFDKTTGDPLLDKLRKEDTKEKGKQNERITEEIKTINSLQSGEEKKRHLLQIAQEDEALAEKILDKITEENEGLTSSEKKLKDSSVNVRASYIHEEIKDLPKAEQKERVLYYAEKGILTEDVLDKLLLHMGDKVNEN